LSKADKRRTDVDIMLQYRRELKKQYGSQRQAATGLTSTSSAGMGSAGGSQAGAPQTGFLKTSGDTMIGPIAYFTRSISGAEIPAVGNNNTMDVSERSSAYTSHIVWGAGGSNQLDIIAGAVFTGQIIVIESTETLTQTITDESNVTGPPAGNIKTLDGNDLVLGTRKTLVYFMFSNIDSFWHQVSNPAGGGGISASDNVVWTGIHIFNGSSFTVNSPIIQVGFTGSDSLVINAGLIGSVVPLTDNSVNLGSATKRWSDIRSVSVTANTLTATISLSSTGTTILGDSSTDTIAFVGRANTNLLPIADNTYNLGTASRRWFRVEGTNVRGDTVTAESAATLKGSIALGTSTAHNITVTGRISSNFQPNNDLGRAMGASSLRWSTGWFGKIDVQDFGSPAGTFDGGSTTAEALRINNSGGVLRFDGNAISLSATKGFQTLPTNPVAFINIKVGSTNYRVPYYLP